MGLGEFTTVTKGQSSRISRTGPPRFSGECDRPEILGLAVSQLDTRLHPLTMNHRF